MAYTFGAGGTDKIDLLTSFSLYAGSRASLMCGWFYPTTLTAGRRLWSSGATSGVQIDTVTTDISMIVDHTGGGSVDGVWTAPAGLAVDGWRFIAVLFDGNASNSQAFAVWAGGPDEAPTSQTVTSIIPALGTVSTGSTTTTIGNTSSGSNAFQGDIAQAGPVVVDTNTTPNLLNQLKNGTINVPDLVYRRWVEPTWRGDVASFSGYGRIPWSYSATAAFPLMGLYPLDINNTGRRPPNVSGYAAPTVTGATVSTRRPPRLWNQNSYDNPSKRRRLGRGYLMAV